MTIRAFGGPAGTGKTTRLIEELERQLARKPLGPDERVLAITRMHGSRLRLIERLSRSAARRQFDCFTFDKVAWHIVSRWRSRCTKPPSELDYDGTCRDAAALLETPVISHWVARRYPVVLIDEFQDCHNGRLRIVQGLAKVAVVLIAADEFQDLSQTAANAAVAWMRSSTEVEELTQVRRTSQADLLDAAAALRAGSPIDGNRPRFKIFSAPNANVAAASLARGIAWSGGEEVVILSAAKGEKSPFVRDALVRLASGPFIDKNNKAREFGPYSVMWEQSRDTLEAELCVALSLPSDPDQTIEPSFSDSTRLPGRKELETWFSAQRRMRGRVSFSVREVVVQVQRCVQRLRSRPLRTVGLRAMTIHQAKNREFDRVLVLWPLALGGAPEAQRRLLYNAVTRAKKMATIIVQDPKKGRLLEPPFR